VKRSRPFIDTCSLGPAMMSHGVLDLLHRALSE